MSKTSEPNPYRLFGKLNILTSYLINTANRHINCKTKEFPEIALQRKVQRFPFRKLFFKIKVLEEFR